jgi:hypothetical protein
LVLQVGHLREVRVIFRRKVGVSATRLPSELQDGNFNAGQAQTWPVASATQRTIGKFDCSLAASPPVQGAAALKSRFGAARFSIGLCLFLNLQATPSTLRTFCRVVRLAHRAPTAGARPAR